jgi:8-oxo-dGTP diphosphatase
MTERRKSPCALPMSEQQTQPRLTTAASELAADALLCPTVDVRVVLFTLVQGELLVAVHRGPETVRLPRDLPSLGESLDTAARRIVSESSLIHEQYMEQLYTLSVSELEDKWSIIVGYIALICSESNPVATESITWVEASRLDGLSEADRMVVEYAVVRLQAKLGYTNIAFHLLPETFTLTELQTAYETILGQRLDKRNFRRRMIASGILTETNDKRREGSHRPAALYRFRAERDTAAYLTPPWSEPADGAASK